MALTRRSGLVEVGSKSTVAEPVIRLTLAALTPAVFSSVRCTRALHAAFGDPGQVTELRETPLAALSLDLLAQA